MTEFLSAIAGVFIGAAVTFFVERYKENKKEREEQYAAIVRTQLALIAQLNTVSNVKKQHLDPLRNDPKREAKLISFHMTDNPIRVKYDSLAFMLRSANPNIVMQILSAEQTFMSAMDALTIRNHAYANLHRNAVIQGVDETGNCQLAVKDPRDIKFLLDTTNALYTTVDNAFERAELQITELFKYGKAHFAKREFLKVSDQAG